MYIITSNNIGVDNKDGGKVVISGIKIDTIGIALYNRTNTTTETISNPGILITSGLIESDNIAISNNENRAIDIQGGTIKSNAEKAIYNLGNTKIQIANATVEGTSGIESSQGEIIVNEGANIIGTTNKGIVNYPDGIVEITDDSLLPIWNDRNDK